jgi:hypothetical protein
MRTPAPVREPFSDGRHWNIYRIKKSIFQEKNTKIEQNMQKHILKKWNIFETQSNLLFPYRKTCVENFDDILHLMHKSSRLLRHPGKLECYTSTDRR